MLASTVCASKGRSSVAIRVSPAIKGAIRRHLSAGHGILTVATLVGVGSGTEQRVKREMAGKLAVIECHRHRSVRDPSLFR